MYRNVVISYNTLREILSNPYKLVSEVRTVGVTFQYLKKN